MSHDNLPDFTKNQVKGKLPTSFDAEKINVVIFNSSEDEMKTFDDWKNSLYNNQNEAIESICKLFLKYPEVHFYLRIHPNLKGVKNLQMKEIESMTFPNLEVIAADDDISTYGLMDACDKVITFGSSTGPEATHRGKPSILLGKTFYDNLDCTYNIDDYNELTGLLLDKNLKPKPAINARKYGYYLANHGEYHTYLKFENNNHFFLDTKLEKIRLRLFYYIIKNFLFRSLQWYRTKKLIEKYGF